MLSLHRQKNRNYGNTPIARELIDKTIEDFILLICKATIREVKAIAAKAEADSGVEL